MSGQDVSPLLEHVCWWPAPAGLAIVPLTVGHPAGPEGVNLAMRDTKQRFFEARRQSVGLAREFVTNTLTAWGLGGSAEDIRLCVSELASNALIHGTKPGNGILVRLAADDDFVRLEVHDSRSTDAGHQPGVAHPAADDTSGRGLLIVDMLADSWGVDAKDPLGKFVWTRFKAAGSPEEIRSC